jgi:predicted Zn-dependent protease
MTGSKARGLLWLVLVIAAAAAMVPGLPWIARHVPWAMERALAGIVGGSPAGAECGSTQAASKQAFDRLVQRIYPLDAQDGRLPISVTVIHGKAVNAYAALGANIYVLDGLVAQAQTPEELAGVLAHEIEHVRNRHIIQGMAVNLFTLGAFGGADPSAGSRLAYLLLTMKFSRQQEEEADALGLERLRRAQVDAAGFRAFFERAQKLPEPPAFVSSHPASAQRAELAARYRDYPVRPVLNAADWQALKGICR